MEDDAIYDGSFWRTVNVRDVVYRVRPLAGSRVPIPLGRSKEGVHFLRDGAVIGTGEWPPEWRTWSAAELAMEIDEYVSRWAPEVLCAEALARGLAQQQGVKVEQPETIVTSQGRRAARVRAHRDHMRFEIVVASEEPAWFELDGVAYGVRAVAALNAAHFADGRAWFLIKRDGELTLVDRPDGI